jgi:hypothetical protein
VRTSPFRSATYSLHCKIEKFEAILFPRRSRRWCLRTADRRTPVKCAKSSSWAHVRPSRANSPWHSVLTEPIGSVLRLSRTFGSQKIRTEERTVWFRIFQFGSNSNRENRREKRIKATFPSLSLRTAGTSRGWALGGGRWPWTGAALSPTVTILLLGRQSRTAGHRWPRDLRRAERGIVGAGRG